MEHAKGKSATVRVWLTDEQWAALQGLRDAKTHKASISRELGLVVGQYLEAKAKAAAAEGGAA